MKQFTRVIVQRQEPLSENEIALALHVSDQTTWYRAIVQLIEGFRSEYPQSAAECAGLNNALGMARDLGAHEALTGLLLDLEKKRTGG